MAVISALYSIGLNQGAPRVVRGSRIEHVCGDPTLAPDEDRALGERIVATALRAVSTNVTRPTLFDPMQRAGE